MADIAILVAEEYERRIKITSSRSAKPVGEEQEATGGGGGGGLKLINIRLASNYLKAKLAEDETKKRLEAVSKWVSADSPLGVAASDGFFSA